MTQTQRKEIKEKIISEIESLERSINSLLQDTAPIEPDCCLGDLGRFEMMHEQDVYKKTLQTTQERLKKLQLTLAKVDREDFGICRECDDEIAFERLLLVPETTLCMECMHTN